jgi:hypothetical protein
MSVTIKDGSTGTVAEVTSKKQLKTQAVTISETQAATEAGYAYNINTGDIGYTSSNESGFLYFKNDEAPINGQSDFVIDAVAIGADTLGTVDSQIKISVYANPTGGTLISGALPVEMNANRNFGSSNQLASTSLAYKGVEGATVTGGTKVAQFYMGTGRGFFTVDFELPKGSSIAIVVDPQTSAGTTTMYCAIIGHRKF